MIAGSSRSTARKEPIRPWASVVFLVACVLAVNCRNAPTVLFQEQALSATLSDVLFAGDARCRFTLRFNALDEFVPVSFSWEIDRTRSTLPPIADEALADAGTFQDEFVKVWEWRRVDDGSALILNLSYKLQTERDSVGGKLITYCP